MDCPKCGLPGCLGGAHKMDGDTCLRRQLAAANERAERLEARDKEVAVLRAEIESFRADLAKYTEPLTDEQKSALFGNINFCLAIDTDNLEMIDTAIRRVRGGTK